MINIKNIFSKDIVKVSFMSAIPTFIRMLTGLVSVKIVAVLIGPSGVALTGQLNNFTAILLSISSGGINAGVTKYVAEYSGSENKVNVYLGTSFWITGLLSVICGLVLIIGSNYFSVIILKDTQYRSIFYVFGSTIIFYAFNALLVSIVNGFKEYKKYVIINVLNSLIGLFFSIILALKFRIYGALLSIVTFQSVVFLITISLLRKTSWFKWKSFIRRFSVMATLKLSHYSLMALVTAIVIPIGQLIIRGYITHSLSINGAGLWESMNRISAMYLTVITTSLGVYYLPRLVELKTSAELRHEVWSVYKIVVPFFIAMGITIFLLRNIIVHLVFTRQFDGVESLFGFQLVGDFFKVAAWIIAYIILAKAMTTAYILFEIGSNILIVLLSMYFINKFGIIGATIGYAISYFLYFVVVAYMFRKMLFGKT